MVIGIVIGTALLAGFLAGFVCFKKTNEFCGRCGVTRECPVCAHTVTTTRTTWRTPRRGNGSAVSAAL